MGLVRVVTCRSCFCHSRCIVSLVTGQTGRLASTTGKRSEVTPTGETKCEVCMCVCSGNYFMKTREMLTFVRWRMWLPVFFRVMFPPFLLLLILHTGVSSEGCLRDTSSPWYRMLQTRQ